MPRRKNAFQSWIRSINWNKRVKAVCKPCWELKYCPYGPLVEDFPLQHPHDPVHSCRIFGHDCPVFTVAEPFTETRELRNVSRHIPRPIQFRVLKRDNQICALCEKSVLDGKIHFDHVIPWSKGGPTEEHNIRLLCDTCNRKRGAAFEDEHLIKSFNEHVMPAIEPKMIRMLVGFVAESHGWRARSGKMPTGKIIAKATGFPHSAFEDRLAEMYKDLDAFFNARRPEELNAKVFAALKDRWGFNSKGRTSTLNRSASSHKVPLESLTLADMDLVRRLGFNVSGTRSARVDWARC